MWNTAVSNPFECSKSTILAKMVSGRYRTDMLCRHWNNNRSGYCRATNCKQIPGTLEHLLVTCPALSSVRERLYQMWLEKSVMFPVLHATIQSVLSSAAPTIVQFVLEPLAFPSIFEEFLKLGNQFAQQLSYLTRTFAFYMDRQYKNLIKEYNNPTPPNEIDLTDSTNSIYFAAKTNRCEEDTRNREFALINYFCFFRQTQRIQ